MKYYTKFLYIALEAVLLKLHAKLAPGWALMPVNFDSIQEIGPNIRGGSKVRGGCSYGRLQHKKFKVQRLSYHRMCLRCWYQDKTSTAHGHSTRER